MKNDDERFVQQVRETLDHSVSNLDSDVAVRLRAARLKGLDAAEEKRGLLSIFSGGFLPYAGALAAAMVFLAIFWVQRPMMHDYSQEFVTDAEILDSEDNMEMLLDIDFYVWLAEEQGNGAG